MHTHPYLSTLALPLVPHNEEVKAMSGQNEESGKMEIRDMRQGDWLWTHKAILFSPYINDSAFKVYCGLASYAGNKDQRSWPSTQTLATNLHLGKSTVLRALAILEACGVIGIERRSGTSSVYSLLDIREVKAPTVKKVQSPHHRFVDTFHKATMHFRGIKPTYSPKDMAALKRVLALNILSAEELEQLAIYFLALPGYKEFSPSLATFFSSGILNGLMNKMRNSETFWKDLDRYAVAFYGSANTQIVQTQPDELEKLIASLGAKMKMPYASEEISSR